MRVASGAACGLFCPLTKEGCRGCRCALWEWLEPATRHVLLEDVDLTENLYPEAHPRVLLDEERLGGCGLSNTMLKGVVQ